MTNWVPGQEAWAIIYLDPGEKVVLVQLIEMNGVGTWLTREVVEPRTYYTVSTAQLRPV